MKIGGVFLYLPGLEFQQVIEHNRYFGLLSVPKSKFLSLHFIFYHWREMEPDVYVAEAVHHPTQPGHLRRVAGRVVMHERAVDLPSKVFRVDGG